MNPCHICKGKNTTDGFYVCLHCDGMGFCPCPNGLMQEEEIENEI